MISLVNEFSAVLDTCVLLPISLCDLLLRLAEDPALYSPKWSPSILDELRRKLQSPKFNLSEEKAQYRIACMVSAFPEAMVTGCDAIVDSMPNHVDDRHVLAAAVCGKADAIITNNLRDFPVDCLRRFGVERMTPDNFLVHQWSLDSEIVMRKVEEQVIECKKDMRVHLELLGRMVPKFAAAVSASLRPEPGGKSGATA